MNDFTVEPSEFSELFLHNVPFLDVRAEVEFEKGAFPTARNYPILTTDERQQVGQVYKRQGQEQAIKLGHQLVSGELKAQRIYHWCRFAKENPSAVLYCWRGGMRSNLTQQWMQQAGVDIPVVKGGYKALRQRLIKETEDAAQSPMLIISGSTGTAKTPLIQSLKTGIDLEGFAQHRGSSFGRRIEQPPSQLDFENAVAIDIVKKRHEYPATPLFIEDESRLIGPEIVPLSLWRGMCEADIAVVVMPLAFRVQRILKEYVVDMLAEYQSSDPHEGVARYREHLLSSLFRLRKRLGSLRYRQLVTIMEQALDEQINYQRIAGHELWIEALLTEYYDPMYNYQLDKKRSRVVFTGDYDQVKQWSEQKQSRV